MQRNTIITIVIVSILIVGVGVYFLIFSSSSSVIVAKSGTNIGFPIAGQTQAGNKNNSIGGFSISSDTNSAVSISKRLVKISNGPVVLGESVVDIKPANASSTPDVYVRYLEQQSGNVFEYKQREHSVTRINNKTILGIKSAQWTPDGSTSFVRYLSGINSSIINTYTLYATSSQGFFLPQDLSMIDISNINILSLASSINGSTVSLSRLDGTHTINIFKTPLSSIRVSFAGPNKYLVSSKPSAILSGYSFIVTKKGDFSRIAGPHNGLVAVASHSGKKVLISYTNKGSLHMGIIDVATKISTPLPLATIADKCVWAPDDSAIYCGVPTNINNSMKYPDSWYQGVSHFSDKIWKINILGRYAQLILDFSKEKQGSLDAESLMIDKNNLILVFVNRNNGSLWSYSF